jgi:6-phosphogluconolactonase (cycloisomerase 2 family)
MRPGVDVDRSSKLRRRLAAAAALAAVLIAGAVTLISRGASGPPALPTMRGDQQRPPAAPTHLAERGCLADIRAASNFSQCAPKVRGLAGAIKDVVSPDGRNVYVTTETGGEVTVFSRDASGKLTELQCFGPADYTPAWNKAPSSCTAKAVGINGAIGEVVSRDGRWLYVTGTKDDAVVTFRRDPSTGMLTWARCMQDDQATHYYRECSHAAGLGSARWIALSPDGRNAYVADLDHAIATLSRDPDTGALRELDCIKDVNDTGRDNGGVNYPYVANCRSVGPGLWYNREVIVSPDGRSVYSTDNYGFAIAEFSRDPGTGRLTELGCVADRTSPSYTGRCTRSTSNLRWIFSLAISADGRYLYAGGQQGQVDAFERDPATGRLIRTSCVALESDRARNGCAQTTANVDDNVGVTLSPDGSRLWAVNFGPLNSTSEFGLVELAVDKRTGLLSPAGCVEDAHETQDPGCALRADGLYGARSVAFSPDGTQLYATASVAYTLSTFDLRR